MSGLDQLLRLQRWTLDEKRRQAGDLELLIDRLVKDILKLEQDVQNEIEAARNDVAEKVVVTGTLVPREEVLVAPEIDGLSVSEILVEEGDHVEKGQVLARLNRDTLDNALLQIAAQIARADAAAAQAQAQVAQVQANKQQLSRALDRTLALKSKGYATAAKLDQDQMAASVADAQLDSALKAIEVAAADKKALEAQRDQTLWRIGRSEVRAPSAGLVSHRAVRIGQIGGMAGEPMFRIIAEGDIELEAEVPDQVLPRMKKGMAVAVQPAGLTEMVQGKIRLLPSEVDKATRLGHVRISLAHDDRLAIGASAQGAVEIGRRNGVTVPLGAIAYDKDGAYVMVVADGIVHQHKVVLGLLGSSMVEVTSGLAEGDLVIARAGSFVRDGDKVRAVEEPIQEAAQ